MSETIKERIQGSCPICGSPCFLSETKSGNEYSYFCKTGKHRGFISREEDIGSLFQLEEVGHAIPDNQARGSEPGAGSARRPATAADFAQLPVTKGSIVDDSESRLRKRIAEGREKEESKPSYFRQFLKD